MLQAIQNDLESSPFTGEGHRKVWARLRILRDIRASREGVLRLMREHHLLSPHRGPLGEENLHDGRITTDTPNEMWGTDGVRIQTVEDGLVWVFAAVDHCDGYCAGIHAVKAGDRFAALEPVAQGLQSEFGGVSAAIGAGLTLRMDHGSQYTSDDFRNQLKFWGVTASYAFVAEPQTNGVAERVNRTMKEQTIHGRIFRNVDEVRDAVVDFKDRYNREWWLKNWASCHPSKLVRHGCLNRPPESQNRVQTIRADTTQDFCYRFICC
ncbi:DDE-type integrase/transposase/recombinase [Paraburkholderia mimosarum]|uniref:DDE-type integrase/transposase/recombinase n=1 Tax=Paraburkholderia mimosarum TaxID=312026 RepID=UPI0014700D3F|nr:DDE-type integrase/transposase/recombinase [Paraburkholderia mimosarum]